MVAVFGNCDTTWVDGVRLVIRPSIGRRPGKGHALPVCEEASVRVHIRYDHVIIVLAEEQMGAVRGIADAGE